MGKKKKVGNKPPVASKTPGIKPNNPNISKAKNKVPSQKKAMTVQPRNTAAAVQNTNAPYVQLPGTNIYVPKPGYYHPSQLMHPNWSVNQWWPGTNMYTNQLPVQSQWPINQLPQQPQYKIKPKKKKQKQPNGINMQKSAANINTNQRPVQTQSTNVNQKQLPQQSQSKMNPQNKNQNQPTASTIQRPGPNVNTNQQPTQSQCTNVNKNQLPQQSQNKINPQNKNQNQPTASNIQRPGPNVNTNQQPTQSQCTNVNKNQLPQQSQNKINPQTKTQNQPTVGNIQKPGPNVNRNQQPAQSQCTNVNKNQLPQQSQNKINPQNKNPNQPTVSNIQRPGPNVNTNQQTAQSQCTNVNKNQLPQQSQNKINPQNKNQNQPTASNIQRPGPNVNRNQQPAQSQCTNVNKNQLPQQSQKKINPQTKTQNQPTVGNIKKPGPNINTNQLPGQPQYKLKPKKKRKKKKPKQQMASNIQRPGTNVNTKPLPVQSQSNLAPNSKTQQTAGNLQRPAISANTKQVPVQSQSNVTANNKTQQQSTGINTQRPVANVNNKQLPVQSGSKATPNNKIQPTGSSIQQQASKPGHTPGLQSQDTTAAVTSTSGGTENSAAPKQVEEVDLTDDIIEIPYVKEVIEVDLTKDDIEVESMMEVTDVDSMNAARLLTAQPDILSDKSPDVWHKVIVKSAQVDRVAVLNAINKQISPEKLNPYFFQMEDGHITFLVNNCSASLSTLFKRNLKVPFSPTQIELKVQLHAKKVSLSEILHKVVSERLNFERSFLDLSNLASIPEIQEVLYHPSVTSHLEHELLKTAQLMAPYLISLSIAGNEMSTLRHLSDFFTDNVKWRTLKKLDVSDNKIDSFSELRFFKSLCIKELNLDRNPLCGKYKEDAYVRVVKVNFPHILKLDGTYLQCLPNLPQWRPNYICSSDCGDSAELADQFVEHFFVLYDHDDRVCLSELYHKDAYFSVSSTYFHGQSTSNNARLSAYIAECRNLLHPSYKLRSKTALARGTEQILDRFDELPRTQHDPYSFTVDLVHHSEKSAVLTVTGVFRERDIKLQTSPRHFMRTFILIRLENDEYQIVNDIMYVTNASTAQATESFTYIHPLSALNRPKQLTESDKNSMVARHSEVTGMKIEWSRKCLNSADWNLRKALKSFIKLYEGGQIPESWFIKRPKK